MDIHGRQRELELLDRFLIAAAQGGGRLLLQGDAGIGKTTLWRHALERAGDFQVLVSRPAEADASLPYAGLADLLDPVASGDLARLPDPQRQALEIALLRATPTERPPDPRAVFTAFLTTLQLLAQEAPVLIAVDDLQWLDAPSARALAFAARRLGSARVALLAALRLDSDTPLDWFDPPERVRLEPLTPATLHRLVKERLDWSIPRPTLLRLHEACAGNAFYALEIARRLMASGAGARDEAWPIPEDVRDLVDLHLGVLPVAVRRSLLLAAAAAQPTRDLIDDEAFTVARDASILTVGDGGRLRFTHPLYASAIYLGATREERRHAHARLAASASDEVERARHLGEAATAPDEAIAEALEQASSVVRMRGAPEIAAKLQERAWELTPVDDLGGRAERALAAAAFFLHAGALADAGSILSTVLEAASEPAVRASALRLLGLVRFREKSMADGAELLYRAAQEAGDRPELRAPAELDLALVGLGSSLDHHPALLHADTALEFAERMGNTALLSDALAIKTLIDFLVGNSVDEERLERALTLEDLESEKPREFTATMVAGSLAFYRDDVEEARARLYPFRAQLLERGEESDLPLLSIHLAWMECLAGRLDHADALAREALEFATLGDDATMQMHAHSFIAFLAGCRGEEKRCREHAAAVAAGPDSCLIQVWQAAGLATLELALDRPADAHAALARLSEFFSTYGRVDPFLLAFIPDDVEALAALGEVDHAERLTRVYTGSAEAAGRESPLAAADRCTAVLLSARDDLHSARALAERSTATLGRLAMPLELGRSLLLLGRINRRLKQKAAARDALARAVAVFDEAGAILWAERARTEHDRVGRRVDGDELTPSEERVAALAASGLTNREVAATAFLSQKTVEANLSRIYRKLGIRSRAELGLRLAARDHDA